MRDRRQRARRDVTVMRVLYVIDSLHSGGSETSLVEVLPGLREQGVDTTIVTLLPDDGSLSRRLTALGVEVHRLAGAPWSARALQLRRMIKGRRPDIVHTSLIWADLVGRLSSTMVQVPVVTSLVNSAYGPEHRANSDFGPWGVRLWQGIDVLASRRTTVFHAVSEEVRRAMAPRLRVPADRIRVIYRGRGEARLGVRSQERRLAARRMLELPERAPVVVAVGRLDRQKAMEVTIAAFARLQQRCHDLHLLIVGREGNASAVARAAAGGLRNVRFLGQREDVPDLMCAADCLSFPSRWEGLPGTVIEALALELPVVASAIEPTKEALGDIAWPLVPVDDPVALAQGIEAVLEARLPVSTLAEQGRRRFLETFTVTRAAAAMAQLYREAIGLRNPRTNSTHTGAMHCARTGTESI